MPARSAFYLSHPSLLLSSLGGGAVEPKAGLPVLTESARQVLTGPIYAKY